MLRSILCLTSILSLIATKVTAHPIDSLKIADYGGAVNPDDGEYDVIIDQRQNGSQNFRIKVDGLFIAIPENYVTDESASDPPSSQLESLFSPSQQSSSSSSASAANFGDLADLANLFDWKKKSRKPIHDTEGRTKDIPTDVQALDDAKVKLRESAAKQKRKYKLLLVGVNERYIKPLLKYLQDKSVELEHDQE